MNTFLGDWAAKKIEDLQAEIERLREQLFNAEQQVIKAEKSRYCALSIAEIHSDQWNEAVLALEASQAREQKLREALLPMVEYAKEGHCGLRIADEALAMPHDDTALREYRRKVLLEAAEAVEEAYCRDFTAPIRTLRRMAEEE